MNLTPTELARRRPVWLALSEFFLDTELEPDDLERIAAVLRHSKYSIEEITRILKFEVGAACWINLISVAGEWSGVDPTWLEKEIARRRLPGSRRLFGNLAIWMIRDNWRAVRDKLREKQNA